MKMHCADGVSLGNARGDRLQSEILMLDRIANFRYANEVLDRELHIVREAEVSRVDRSLAGWVEPHPLFAAPEGVLYDTADLTDSCGKIPERLIAYVVLNADFLDGHSLHPRFFDRLLDPINSRAPVSRISDGTIDISFHIENTRHETQRMIAEYAFMCAVATGGDFHSIIDHGMKKIPPVKYVDGKFQPQTSQKPAILRSVSGTNLPT